MTLVDGSLRIETVNISNNLSFNQRMVTWGFWHVNHGKSFPRVDELVLSVSQIFIDVFSMLSTGYTLTSEFQHMRALRHSLMIVFLVQLSGDVTRPGAFESNQGSSGDLIIPREEPCHHVSCSWWRGISKTKAGFVFEYFGKKTYDVNQSYNYIWTRSSYTQPTKNQKANLVGCC